MISKRWGQENLIKSLKLRHLLDYFPGYIFEELIEQPLVDNPAVNELKKKKGHLVSQLHKIELSLAEKIIDSKKDERSLKELKKEEIEIFSEIVSLKSQITLIDIEISKLPEEISFDFAQKGVKMLEMDYEKKIFLDCIKVFVYHMEKKMCEILYKYYDKKKELLPALSMIVRRGAYVKLIEGKLYIKLRRFTNPEINYAAKHLCKELNKLNPKTLDKYHLPVHYDVA